MKILFLSISILFSLSASAEINDIIGVPTPAKDTLFLINEPVGYLIKSIWDNDTKIQIKPVLVMVDYNTLVRKQKYYEYIINHKKQTKRVKPIKQISRG